MQTHSFLDKIYGGNVKNLVSALLRQDILSADELKEQALAILYLDNCCDAETWYVIESAGYQYIYFGGLPMPCSSSVLMNGHTEKLNNRCCIKRHTKIGNQEHLFLERDLSRVVFAFKNKFQSK